MVALLTLLGLLAALISLSVFVGVSLSVDKPSGILHFADCKFPCWLGITPGHTTITEAQERIRRVYGTVDYKLDITANVWRVTAKESKEQILILLYPISAQPDQVAITELLISYRSTSGSGIPISDLFAVSGRPDDILLSAPDAAPYPVLRYGNLRMNVAFDSVIAKGQCGQISLKSPVSYMALYESLPTSYAWLSDPVAWQGFKQCYQFLRLG